MFSVTSSSTWVDMDNSFGTTFKIGNFTSSCSSMTYTFNFYSNGGYSYSYSRDSYYKEEIEPNKTGNNHWLNSIDQDWLNSIDQEIFQTIQNEIETKLPDKQNVLGNYWLNRDRNSM